MEDQIDLDKAIATSNGSAEGLWRGYCEQEGIKKYLETLKQGGYVIIKQEKLDLLEKAMMLDKE